MEQINSLFNLEPKSKATSERATLIEFFHQNVKNKKGKRYPVSFIGMKLSHLSLADLYYMKSTALDYEHRGGEIGKYFWGALKAK